MGVQRRGYAFAQARLDDVRLASHTGAVEPAQYPPGEQLPGTVYRVVRHLATGGMGSVYDVEDVTVGKRYVLKTLHPQLISRQDLAKRMEAEARTLAKLQHPNIVDVVTAGLTTDEKRMPFYVMERLNGQNLRVVIDKKGSLELTHCYRIAIDVLDALEHAHENSVIHRDVKPENIFLHRNTNGTTTTKLLDFGIMRLLDRKVSDTQGKFIGTLRYASPEQIFGGELGPSTDIYSLGMVLYEMIAGRGPFDDVGDAYAIGAAHAQRTPPPLSEFVAVPAQLDRLVAAALGKAPQDRPRDCFSFASELRRMLRDEEASPKSATAVAALSAAPETRGLAHAGLANAGTEPSSDTGPKFAPHVATKLGMIEPPVASETLAAAAHTNDPQPGGIDRSADTRTSAGVEGSTLRLAKNGTSVDAGGAPTLPDDAVRAALGQREPLVVLPTGPHDSRNLDLVFPPATYTSASGTGPLGGEARTRPPERGMLFPMLSAAAVGALLVCGAALFITKPWVKRGGEAPLPDIASATADRPSSPPPTPSATSALSSAPVVAPETSSPSDFAAAPRSGTSASATSRAPTRPAPLPPPRKSPRPPGGGAPRPEDVKFD